MSYLRFGWNYLSLIRKLTLAQISKINWTNSVFKVECSNFDYARFQEFETLLTAQKYLFESNASLGPLGGLQGVPIVKSELSHPEGN